MIHLRYYLRPHQGKVARMICDVYKPDGTQLENDPILKRVIGALDINLTWVRNVNFSYSIQMTMETLLQ